MNKNFTQHEEKNDEYDEYVQLEARSVQEK